MKKSVKIEGLDCPNCARALEGEINKLEIVENASIDFINKKLTTLSVIGAACLGEYMESLMVVGLYTIGKILENVSQTIKEFCIEDFKQKRQH